MGYWMPYRATEPVRWMLLTMLERMCALLAFVVLLPFLICVAAAIACFSGQSPLIAHRRLGRGGRTFWVLKFRTMWPVETPPLAFRIIDYIVDEHGPGEKDEDDPRISSG